jgi:hypothetical protein
MPARNNSLAFALSLTLAAVGCRQAPQDSPRQGIGFYLSNTQDIRQVKRVSFVELGPPESRYSNIGRDTTAALAKAIQKKQLFQLEIVPVTDRACRDLPMESLSKPLSFERIAALRKALESDVVLYGRIRYFRPYPHMQMGLFLKMVDLRTAKILWGVDHVWDTADAAMEDRLKGFFEDRQRQDLEPVKWRLALMSDLAFEEFVAYEAAGTLPSSGQADPAPRHSVPWGKLKNLSTIPSGGP